ncbi:MAG: hypothetical protein H7Z19_00395 [Chitinophagaceae bacterium]|nr:hypothetical protein [Rubrivivax sp.]
MAWSSEARRRKLLAMPDSSAGARSGFEPAVLFEEAASTFQQFGGGVFTGHRQHVLAVQRGAGAGLAQDARQVLFDEVRLAFFDHQQRPLAGGKTQHFGVDKRVGHVHHVQRHAAVAVHVRHAQPLQRTQQRVVAAALHDDADVVRAFGEKFVQASLLDELQRRGPAVAHLFLFVHEAGRRQHDAADITLRMVQRVFQRKARALVGAGGELAVHMAGADAQLHHHRRVAGFRELETLLDGRHHAGQVGAWVQQPDLRLHRKRVAAFLHDRRTFAVVFADDDQRAASDTARGQVGQCVRRDVGAHRGLEGDGAAQRVVHRRGQRGGSGGFAGAVLEADAVFGQDVLRVGQHVHQVADRRALVAGDVGDARFQQRLRHCQNPFAAEALAFAQAQLLHFLDKRTFSHGVGRWVRWRRRAPWPVYYS